MKHKKNRRFFGAPKFFKFRGKASLNLSINAIVVLVMAITMLGLGLAFIRGKMGSAGDLISDVEQNVRQAIAEDFAKSDAKISFPKTTFALKSSDEHVFAMGIKNKMTSSAGFKMTLIGISAPEFNDITGGSGENGEIMSSDAVDDAQDQKLAFQFYGSYKDLEPQEYEVVPIKIMTKTATPGDTYLIRVEICETAASGGDCINQQDKYAQKEFFVEIV